MRCRAFKFINYWVPPIFYKLLIIFLSSRPSPKILPPINYIDKIIHTGVYFILALLLWRAFYFYSPEYFKKRAVISAFILTILLGMSDEFHQYFVPSRYADMLDAIFDMIGAGIAMISIKFWMNKTEVDEENVI